MKQSRRYIKLCLLKIHLHVFISSHIISSHISYHLKSYRIISNLISYLISIQIISSQIISYHLISYRIAVTSPKTNHEFWMLPFFSWFCGLISVLFMSGWDNYHRYFLMTSSFSFSARCFLFCSFFFSSIEISWKTGSAQWRLKREHHCTVFWLCVCVFSHTDLVHTGCDNYPESWVGCVKAHAACKQWTQRHRRGFKH